MENRLKQITVGFIIIAVLFIVFTTYINYNYKKIIDRQSTVEKALTLILDRHVLIAKINDDIEDYNMDVIKYNNTHAYEIKQKLKTYKQP